MIEGRVKGAQPGQRIVLFAKSGTWWVQPLSVRPFTEVQPNSTWSNTTHPGKAYAALLVDERYKPPPTIEVLPAKGNGVLAVAIAEGSALMQPAVRPIYFSGYEWQVREAASDPGGSQNFYDPSNAHVDRDGFLHLQIKRQQGRWTSAEVGLTRSLGYGMYRFVVREVSHLEPGAALTFSTWDDNGPSREMNIEISRWGESASRNAQYVIQPYYVPANVVRFMVPEGRHSFSFQWEPGRVYFKTKDETKSSADSNVVSEHVFTSGVPSPGKETARINFYVYRSERNPLQRECEVIIEKFEYLP